MPVQIGENDIKVPGNISCQGEFTPLRARNKILLLESLAKYPIDLTLARVWDSIHTPLSGTPAADDLGIAGNVFGTDSIYLTTGDLKNAGATTRMARIQIAMPAEYEAGETALLRFSAGMLTTVASVSATLNIEAHINGRDRTIDGANLYTGAALTINSLVMADKDFTLTNSSLFPGTAIDVRIAIAVNDSLTATVVAGTIGMLELCCDIRG